MFIENYCHKILCILYQRNPFIKLFMLAFMPNDTIKSRISEIPATHSGQLVQLLDIRCLIEILFLCNWNSSENSLCLKVKHLHPPKINILFLLRNPPFSFYDYHFTYDASIDCLTYTVTYGCLVFFIFFFFSFFNYCYF